MPPSFVDGEDGPVLIEESLSNAVQILVLFRLPYYEGKCKVEGKLNSAACKTFRECLNYLENVSDSVFGHLSGKIVLNLVFPLL